MNNRHKSLFRWRKSQWWPRVLLTVSIAAVGSEYRPARAQDFPDFGSDAPFDTAADLVDEPFAFPETGVPEVEDLPSPTPDAEIPLGEKRPATGVNRSRRNAGLNQTGKRFQEFNLKSPAANPKQPTEGTSDNPLNQPADPARVADFTKKTEPTATRYLRRELTLDEKRHVAMAIRQSDRLLEASESAFREGNSSLTEYSKLLDLSLKMKAVSAEILDKPETLARALDEQKALFRSAGRQMASLDQPAAGRWEAEVLLAQVLEADTAFKLAELQQDGPRRAQAETQRSEVANQLFAQRLRDYGIGLATLQEVTHAASYLLPSASSNMTQQERETLQNALSAYGQLLRSSEETTNRWFASKANMGTSELVSIFMNDGLLHELADIGPDGTGLGPDDEFAELRDFDDLQARSATRPTPLEYGEVLPNQFDTAGETAGVGRIDHLQAVQADVLSLTAQVAHLQGNCDLAQSAYSQSFAASDALFHSELETYQNGTSPLGDVLQAWMTGQDVRQNWEQSGFEPQQDWTTHQREMLSQLTDATERHDPRGAGTAELQLLSSLGTFEQLSDLRSTLKEEAAHRAAEPTTPVPPVNQPFERVQTFLPDGRTEEIQEGNLQN